MTCAGASSDGRPGLHHAHDGCNSRHPAPYDSMRDCFLSYEYWREWKGMQLCRAKIVALLKARAGQ